MAGGSGGEDPGQLRERWRRCAAARSNSGSGWKRSWRGRLRTVGRGVRGGGRHGLPGLDARMRVAGRLERGRARERAALVTRRRRRARGGGGQTSRPLDGGMPCPTGGTSLVIARPRPPPAGLGQAQNERAESTPSFSSRTLDASSSESHKVSRRSATTFLLTRSIFARTFRTANPKSRASMLGIASGVRLNFFAVGTAMSGRSACRVSTNMTTQVNISW